MRPRRASDLRRITSVAEALRIGRDGGHRTIGNWVDGSSASNVTTRTYLGVWTGARNRHSLAHGCRCDFDVSGARRGSIFFPKPGCAILQQGEAGWHALRTRRAWQTASCSMPKRVSVSTGFARPSLTLRACHPKCCRITHGDIVYRYSNGGECGFQFFAFPIRHEMSRLRIPADAAPQVFHPPCSEKIQIKPENFMGHDD